MGQFFPKCFFQINVSKLNIIICPNSGFTKLTLPPPNLMFLLRCSWTHLGKESLHIMTPSKRWNPWENLFGFKSQYMLGSFSLPPPTLLFFFSFLISNIDRTDWIFYNRVAEYVCSIVWLPRRFITVTLESQIRQFCSLVKASIWKEVNTKEFHLK